ncbi:FAD-dependent oxidoreductase [Luteococcus sp. H138]|uniref:FAD-dependent oxidoreductase n=1 Tax=unclassified Luteococcus TaxID=2639923 RepID=UPI00313CFE07
MHTNPMDIVIIGGVAAGMSAAARLRRLDGNACITVVERSGNISFANCGLPYHIGGVIEQRKALLLQTPEAIKARFDIDVFVRTEAVAIRPDQHSVTVRNLDDETERELRYDKLVLAPGASPVRPPLPGIERALGLRNVEDTDAIIAALGEDVTNAVVIGGGFIGVEMAENLVHKGLRVALVEATSQVMGPLDPEMVAPVHAKLRESGVDLRLGVAVKAIGETDVELSDGSRLEAQLVVAAIGVKPESTLAREAGLAVGERGGIIVDEHFRTSDPDVFAVGDAVEKIDAIDGSATLLPLAQTANLQGRRVADLIAGRDVKGRPVMGTAIVGVFGLQVASVGWNEKRLVAAGRKHRIIHTHPVQHAGYYPGAQQMALKLLIDAETDEILGAQGVGPDGVDKRIDVIATAMAGGLKASDLAELELAYAPQFGSAKDPVNMLGFVAENLASGLSQNIQWHELTAAQEAGATLIDVRTQGEFAAGAIPGAILVPVDELRDRLDDLPEGELVVHCAVGIRGHIAAQMLAAVGRPGARNLDGGYKTWSAGMASRG